MATNQQLAFLLNQSLQYLRNGRDDSAELLLKQALKVSPKNSEVFRLLGVIQAKKGNYQDALSFFENASKYDPKNGVILSNQGNVLFELKRYEEALAVYDKAITLAPGYAEAYSNRGNVLFELKRYEEALGSHERAITLAPGYAPGYSNQGNALFKLKRLEEALASHERAIALAPGYAEAYSNRGNVLFELKHYEEALSSFENVLNIQPANAEAYSNGGNALFALRRYEDAVMAFDRAIELKPDYAEAYGNRGNAFFKLKNYEEALKSIKKAIELKPGYAEFWYSQGIIFNELKRHDEALISYDKAIELRPGYAVAWHNRGSVLSDLKRYEEALDSYEKALELDSNLDYLFGQFIHTEMLCTHWDNFDRDLKLLSEKIQQNQKAISPFPLLSLMDSLELHAYATKMYVEDQFASNDGSAISLVPHPKIRIGYFSPDFGNHPVSFLTAELFELHDKDRFETYAFSFGSDQSSPMFHRVKNAFDRFIDVRGGSDQEVAALARELEIDIAVDLTGHTKGSRTQIFAYRAAPIQVSYIGYLGTMGADFMDYLIADEVIIPARSKQYYCEKIVYLPSYQVNDTKRAASDQLFSREELGLPKDGFVFCCFNNNYKLLPATFDLWMRILKAIEGSVLFLYAENDWVKTNLRKEAQAKGINPDRLIFGGMMNREDYLARYRVCDLFLDTSPYNAGTTASDSLWMGVPVLTLIGQSFASRVAASLLTAIHVPELITQTPEQYEALAIELASNPQKLREIKEKLQANRLTTPLFDSEQFTRNLEQAYTKMYERYREGMGVGDVVVR